MTSKTISLYVCSRVTYLFWSVNPHRLNIQLETVCSRPRPRIAWYPRRSWFYFVIWWQSFICLTSLVYRKVIYILCWQCYSSTMVLIASSRQSILEQNVRPGYVQPPKDRILLHIVWENPIIQDSKCPRSRSEQTLPYASLTMHHIMCGCSSV